MKLRTVKAAAEIVLKGVRVELEIVDKNVKAIRLTDADKNLVRIAPGPSYQETICVQVPDPPETVEKLRLTGAVAGIPVDKTFDTDREAEKERSRLEATGHAVDLLIAPVQVPVERADVVEKAGDNDIPF